MWDLSCSPVVPPSLSTWECGTAQSTSHHLTHLVHQLPPFYSSSQPWLPVSASPTCLDESFFFNSLVVKLPHSLIFWQFWSFFVLKLVVVLLVVQGSKAYLPMPPSWPEVYNAFSAILSSFRKFSPIQLVQIGGSISTLDSLQILKQIHRAQQK